MIIRPLKIPQYAHILNKNWSSIVKELTLTRCFSATVIKRNDILLNNDFVTVKSCKNLRNSTFPEFISSPNSQLNNIIWNSPLENIYVVKKPWDQDVRDATVKFITHIHDNYPSVNVIVSEDVADEILHETSTGGSVSKIMMEDTPKSNLSSKYVIYTGQLNDIVNKTDLIVTLGGDGTILRAVSTFLNANVPPVLSFALGTLGFLLPFDYSTFKETFRKVYESRGKALHRHRLECYVVRKSKNDAIETPITNSTPIKKLRQPESQISPGHGVTTMLHAMNDISLHRGSQPNLISLDIYIDNQFLTTTTGDGLVFSTPTGSTAYSLSAGGSITHPLVPCIILTPICPRSLSFRPLILPASSHIMIKLSDKNRNASIKLNIDGILQQDLQPGDQIHVAGENDSAAVTGNINRLAPSTTTSSDASSSSEYTLERKDSHNSTMPASKQDLRLKGIWCVARGENDWTKDINELLGFNSSFKALKSKL